MGQLIAYVYVHDEVGGAHRFGPGDDLPDWAAKKITNPKAWADGVLPSAAAPPADVSSEASPVAPASPATQGGVPPRSGAGSGLAEWLAYAASQNVTDTDGLGRGELIAKLDAAGIPTS